LTGRENVYLSGAILGMRRAETRGKFDQIVEFADVGAFIDTPVKRYSSGMQVRLGFAVAAHLETEILMVDEVLSVGDAEFQRRCLAKIEDVSRGGGRTILFVSHNMQSVRTLCHRAAYLANGELVGLGESDLVVRDYLEHAAVGSPERTWDDPQRRPGDDDIRLVAVRVTDPAGALTPNSRANDGLMVEIAVDVLAPTAGIAVGFDLESSDGTSLLTSYQLDEQNLPPLRPGLTTFRATLPPSLFDDGTFLISPRIVHHNGVVVAHEQGAVSFDVVNEQGPRGSRHIHRAGPLAVPVAWESLNG
jgi:lipopolysaccharide transport system ATP-binding protein